MKLKTAILASASRFLSAFVAVSLLTAVSVYAGTQPSTDVLSNGTGGGSWSSTGTWSGGVLPSTSYEFLIQTGDTVTANSGVSFSDTSNNAAVFGTGILNVNAGASITVSRMNDNNETFTTTPTLGGGTINVTGGTFTTGRTQAHGGTTDGNLIVNVSSGGIFNQTQNTNGDCNLNVENGGTANIVTWASPISLVTGGKLVYTGSGAIFGASTLTWSGGTLVPNTGALGSGALNTLVTGNSAGTGTTGWKSSASNVLQLSNQTSAQTMTINSGAGISASAGTLNYNIYNNAGNSTSCDLINALSGNTGITLGSGVTLNLNGVSLTGTSSSYVGVAYKLFTTTGSYTSITPTVSATVWNIAGTNYNVTWTNTLSTNGTLTVASVSPVVPPIHYGPGNHYAFALDSNGFSIINPGPVHQTIYVSSSTGSNSNNGLSSSTPKATLLAGMELVRAGSSDWVLLKRGDTFSTTDSFGRMGSNTNFGTAVDPFYPQLVGSYGTGARPIVQCQFNDEHVPVPMVNYVMEDLDFANLGQNGAITLYQNTNQALFENCQLSGSGCVVQGAPPAVMSQITFRRCEFLDAHNIAPINGVNWGTVYADIWGNRCSGIYVYDTTSFLFEENILDHNAWQVGYDPSGLTAGPQPPSEYSHNAYISDLNYDLTIRNNISTEGASMGFKFLSTGVIAGNVLVDNNLATTLNNAEGSDPLMFRDNVVMEADDKNAQMIGAEGWGVDIVTGAPTNGEIIRTIEANSTATGSNLSLSTQSTLVAQATLAADNVDFDYGTTPNVNPTGSGYFDDTRTMATYNASVGGLGTLADFITQIRAQERETWNPAYTAEKVVAYAQTGFNLALASRGATTVSFTGASLDGERWDNPDNWSALDIPGSVTNDVADIVAKEVIFDGSNSALARLQLENGAILDLNKGNLTLSGTESIRTVGTAGGTINLGFSGSLYINNYTTSSSPLTINQSDGLLTVGTNLGSGTSVVVTLNVTGGTSILGAPTTGTVFGSGSSLNITGSTPIVGYQTNTGNNLITFNSGSTLSYKFDVNGVAAISEFPGATVTSVLTINSGATLNIDMTARTGLAPGNYSTTLAHVDSLGSGTFSTVNITGTGPGNISSPAVVYNTTAGTIVLTYTVL